MSINSTAIPIAPGRVSIHNRKIYLAAASEIDRSAEKLMGFHYERMPVCGMDLNFGWAAVRDMWFAAGFLRR
ncbi:MAG: hypothetical protein ACLGXA_20255 [Acidobacteriota bacterium]